ncbi:uncharacterized protein N7473_002821 [Penicillium subrubescens]|uniref:Uncharacterized protein n=1 Tax=Penicillium subrubescens TaxID=1316194 RepID=A0A1Q5TD64_9EURO|nr:uncharacterized protein N7473_002821 [Penicillium subrubescens]KAJ5905905.1 hypothetical protein N7473_002821 [Penicillium subrubescens]OKO98160.1 hypothetical protein PENSUB_9258 [Penicillium subrubescens]
MGLTSQQQEQLHRDVKYTLAEVTQTASSWQHLPGAFALPSTERLRQIYADLPTHQPSRDLIDEYVMFRKDNYGWRSTEEDPTLPTIKQKSVDFIYKSKFLRILSKDYRPNFDSLGFQKTERASVMTLWYACRLMKLVPGLFERSQVNTWPYSINAYDSVHGSCLLQKYHQDLKKKDFESAKPQVGSTPIKPKAGPFGEGEPKNANQSGTSQVWDNRHKEISRRYIGPFSEAQRDTIVKILRNPETGYATEADVRKLVRRIGIASLDKEDIAAPDVLDRDAVRVILDEFTGDYFERKCLMYESDQMNSLPTGSTKKDLNITEVLGTGENISSAFEEFIEGNDDALSQEEDVLPQDEDGLSEDAVLQVEKAYTKKLEQVSAPFAPLVEACNYAGIPIIDGQPTLSLRDEDEAQGPPFSSRGSPQQLPGCYAR